MINIPTLVTERLILRAPRLEDAAAIQQHFPHWDIVKYLSRVVPWPYPENGAEDFLKNVVMPGIEKGDSVYWVITLKNSKTDAAIGSIDIRLKGGEHGHRGFWLALPYHRQGLMSEAIATVNDYVFDVLKMDHLIVKNAKENKGSRRVKEKTGAVFLRDEADSNYLGDYPVTEVWEITPESWKKARK